MRSLSLAHPLIFAAALTLLGSPLQANTSPQNGDATTADQDANQEIVQYRLTKWKSVHTGDEKAAQKMLNTLKQIKCEVKTHQHGDHIDITYRCPAWKKLSLKDHKTAHYWEGWLKKYGFETKHIH